MGARFDKVYSYLNVRVISGVIEVVDFLGEVHKGKIPIDMDFNWDKSDYFEDLFVNVVEGDYRLICRYDLTYSLIKESTMELLDMGVFEFDETQFNRTYREVGYKKNYKRVEALLYDDKTNLVMSTISDRYPVDCVYKAKAKLENINLTMSIGLAREPSLKAQVDLFIYKWGGLLEWRDYLDEIPSVL